jgi:ubiquinone/menaquinone biosynthesis C-methylase UbiE
MHYRMALAKDWYDTPHYYDIVFDGGTTQETLFLEQVFVTHADKPLQKKRHLLEPACGSGRLLASMSKAGWNCAGFDANPAMLEYTQQRLKKAKQSATLWQDQMQRFTLPKQRAYSMAHCLVSTFKYLLTEADALSHLQRIAQVLEIGGIYVLGIHLTDYNHLKIQHERWVGQRGATRVVCNTRSWPADSTTRLEKIRTRLGVTAGSAQHTQETHWQFRTYDAKQLKALLRKIPALQCVACYDFQHDIQQPRELDDSYSDLVLVLRRQN